MHRSQTTVYRETSLCIGDKKSPCTDHRQVFAPLTKKSVHRSQTGPCTGGKSSPCTDHRQVHAPIADKSLHRWQIKSKPLIEKQVCALWQKCLCSNMQISPCTIGSPCTISVRALWQTCHCKEGRLPSSQRRAIVTPILKKSGLDAGNVLNYRPISNLTYISKLVERMVNQQMVAYLDENKLLPKPQSGFRARHSTETALLRVLSDILLSADQQQVTLLVLLDMSAAFDTVDHAILLQRLESSFGVSGGVLSWLSSFLDGRTQRVHLLDSTSSVESVRSGVPQGSILGPLLFLLYTADIPLIASDFGLNVHCYADDGQLYISSKAGAARSSIELVTACINQLDRWMSSNRLKLNSGQDSTHLVGQPSTAPQSQSGLDPAGCYHGSFSKLGRGSRSRPGQQPIDEGSC